MQKQNKQEKKQKTSQTDSALGDDYIPERKKTVQCQ